MESSEKPAESSTESTDLTHSTSNNPSAFPWILWCYEVCVLAAWTFIIIKYRHDIEHTYLMKGTWPLYTSIPLSVVVGSISATSFAIYGMYKHQIQRNFAINFVAWYVSKPIVGGIMGGLHWNHFDGYPKQLWSRYSRFPRDIYRNFIPCWIER